MNKLDRLKALLSKMPSVLIAFSGGVDSSFLCSVACGALGKNATAVTAVSPTYTDNETKEAKLLAKLIGIRHKLIRTGEFQDERFVSNPPERCYYCKKALFASLRKLADNMGIAEVLDASNIDDNRDFRPGSRAKKEFSVRSPLQDVRMSKAEIRKYSRQMGLSTWNRPSAACLASRLSYGERITAKKMKMIEKAEEYLKKLGFITVRVRLHGGIARIELGSSEIKRIFKGDIMVNVRRKLKDLGFNYITLDLEGFRSGSMNEVLSGIIRRKK